MIVDIIFSLMNKLGIIIILAVIISKIGIFKRLISKKDASASDKIILAVVFGLIGVLGTYSSVPVNGALANTRVVGVMVGALLGGPLVGFIAAVIAGGHRFLIDVGGFTAVACAVSTIAEGLIGGYFHYYLKHKAHKWKYALGIGILAEVVQMIIILMIARPFIDALELVRIISLPMVFVNSIGIALFIGVLDNIYNEQERIAAALQAHKALDIANQTLPYFRQGLNKHVAENVVRIIHNSIDVSAVSITDTKEILAHIGSGEDHHISGELIRTNSTKVALKSGNHQIINESDAIYCEHSDCPLKSAIIIPLKEREETVGTLKLYKNMEHSITNLDEELALGLAQLFSTQIEVSRVQSQEKLLVDAELKNLQAQIKPHFLFNALNTIQSFMLIDGTRAKSLLTSLAIMFRKSLSSSNDFISLNQELDYIKSYVEIEQARFGDRLTFNFDVPENVIIKIPPLILQPIVENAVIHGILPQKNGGSVTISSKPTADEITIEIADTGKGMSKDQLDHLMIKINSNDENKYIDSIGLFNVNKRLINLYGEGYALDIHSTEGIGTSVQIRIPIGA